MYEHTHKYCNMTTTTTMICTMIAIYVLWSVSLVYVWYMNVFWIEVSNLPSTKESTRAKRNINNPYGLAYVQESWNKSCMDLSNTRKSKTFWCMLRKNAQGVSKSKTSRVYLLAWRYIEFVKWSTVTCMRKHVPVETRSRHLKFSDRACDDGSEARVVYPLWANLLPTLAWTELLTPQFNQTPPRRVLKINNKRLAMLNQDHC